jgi:hypothetical protein
VNAFEETMTTELTGLLRAGVPVRGIRLTVRELVVTRIECGPLDAREITDAVEAAVRAACRLVRELDAPPEVVETVCRGALEAVRGHGGESARWFGEAADAASAVLDVQARERIDERTWGWLAGRVPQWVDGR